LPTASGDPYYPIPKPSKAALYSKYQALARHLKDTYFVGRLATYKYYNMDQVVAQALSTFKKIRGKEVLSAPTGVKLAQQPEVVLTSSFFKKNQIAPLSNGSAGVH